MKKKSRKRRVAKSNHRLEPDVDGNIYLAFKVGKKKHLTMLGKVR